jgi:hypothetical protein
MYILIVLATMTNLGTYPTQARCEAAVRQIYAQQMDPYNIMDPAVKQKVLALKMKYSAPKQYRCQKN